MEKEPKTCAFALGHLNQQFRHNRISPCFRTVAKIGDHSRQLMSEVVNSPEAREHRRTLMSGNWPDGCISCKDFEEAGIRSTRLHGLSDESFDVPKLLRGYDPDTGAITMDNLTSIEIRFGNECNLQCRHCDHLHSSKWAATVKARPDMLDRLDLRYSSIPQDKPPGYYEDIIENIVPHISVIMFSGGETLYQKQHYIFLDNIPEEHARKIRLLYVTNGTVTGTDKYNAFDLWKKFNAVNVIVSTDGSGRLFEYFRHGANWDTVVSNMRAMKAIEKPRVTMTAEVTTSVLQIMDLPRICDDIYDIGVDYMSSSLVQSPGQLNVRIIPDHLKARITADWQAYLSSVTDAKKLKMVRSVGDMVIGYMNAPNNTKYVWKDFWEHLAAQDELFGNSLESACPDIARYMS